jgi:hypothetical protein
MRWTKDQSDYIRQYTGGDSDLTFSLNRTFGTNRTVEAVRKYRQRLKCHRGDGVYRTNIGIVLLRNNTVYRFGVSEGFSPEGIVWGERLSGVDNSAGGGGIAFELPPPRAGASGGS